MQRLAQAGPRLGSLGVQRKGIEVQEVWEDGQACKDIKARMAQLAEQRESIEAARKVGGGGGSLGWVVCMLLV